jgi:uncharacterized protein
MHEQWYDSDGNNLTLCVIIDSMKDYVRKGGKIYVGTDSMLFSANCVYASAICMHNPEMKIAKYFYCKEKDYSGKSRNLKHKITQEVNYSIEIALFLLEQFPEANIEIHADVGASNRSATNKFVEFIRGWILGSGFKYQIKPYSWASSSVADWHTK